jgi:hypothetical protein
LPHMRRHDDVCSWQILVKTLQCGLSCSMGLRAATPLMQDF